MEPAEQFEWILRVREQALLGRSGTGVARWLLREQGLDQFSAYQVVMDAFDMDLRDARELETLLARPDSQEERLLDSAWAPFLQGQQRWPRRVLRLTREGTRPLTVTFHLFDFASPGAALQLDWGDGQEEAAETEPLCVRNHAYASSGQYTFHCSVAGEPPLATREVLDLQAQPPPGTSRWTLRR